MIRKLLCWLGFHHYCLYVYHGSENIEIGKNVFIRPTSKSVIKCEHCGRVSYKLKYAKKIHIIGGLDENI